MIHVIRFVWHVQLKYGNGFNFKVELRGQAEQVQIRSNFLAIILFLIVSDIVLSEDSNGVICWCVRCKKKRVKNAISVFQCHTSLSPLAAKNRDIALKIGDLVAYPLLYYMYFFICQNFIFIFLCLKKSKFYKYVIEGT